MQAPAVSGCRRPGCIRVLSKEDIGCECMSFYSRGNDLSVQCSPEESFCFQSVACSVADIRGATLRISAEQHGFRDGHGRAVELLAKRNPLKKLARHPISGFIHPGSAQGLDCSVNAIASVLPSIRCRNVIQLCLGHVSVL